MRVQVIVAVGAVETAGSCSRTTCAILELIGENVGLIVGEPEAHGEAPAVIGGADVPGIGRRAQESRVVGASRYAGCPGVGIPVVGGNAKATQPAPQEGKVLQISSFEPGNCRAARVDGSGNDRRPWRGGWRQTVGEEFPEGFCDDLITDLPVQ